MSILIFLLHMATSQSIESPTQLNSRQPDVEIGAPGAGYFIAKTSNYFLIAADQKKPVSAEQVRAIFIDSSGSRLDLELHKQSIWFVINPPDAGWLEFEVNVRDTIVRRTANVRLITARASLSHHASGDTLSAGEMRAQFGIHNTVCCGFDVNCTILNYEVIRIDITGFSQKTQNSGGRFQEARELIDQASAGDIYVFRNIDYRCPGSSFVLRMNDLIFDIK